MAAGPLRGTPEQPNASECPGVISHLSRERYQYYTSPPPVLVLEPPQYEMSPHVQIIDYAGELGRSVPDGHVHRLLPFFAFAYGLAGQSSDAKRIFRTWNEDHRLRIWDRAVLTAVIPGKQKILYSIMYTTRTSIRVPRLIII